MRIFVYEYLSSGAAGADAAVSLLTEGWAMLSAVLEDFSRCPQVEVSTLLDPRLLPRLSEQVPGIIPHLTETGAEEQIFRKLAGAAEWSLVIAPEFGDLLTQRCRWVEEAGGRLLGPSPVAVRLTADKLTLGCHWHARGIPTPAILDPPSGASLASYPFPLVSKPRDGAGAQATFLIRDEEQLGNARRHAQTEGWMGEMILQRYQPGLPASVTFIIGRDEWRALPAVEQHLSNDGRFHYLGGRLPLLPALDRRARQLAERAARCVDGLHGWFGVDLILGDAEDGSGDAVIEINPRLTTSYVGLRRLARFNLAASLLAIAAGSRMPPWEWRTEPIAFRADS